MLTFYSCLSAISCKETFKEHRLFGYKQAPPAGETSVLMNPQKGGDQSHAFSKKLKSFQLFCFEVS